MLASLRDEQQFSGLCLVQENARWICHHTQNIFLLQPVLHFCPLVQRIRLQTANACKEFKERRNFLSFVLPSQVQPFAFLLCFCSQVGTAPANELQQQLLQQRRLSDARSRVSVL